MSLLRKQVESRKTYIIEQLLRKGVYKKDNTQLYELTLNELEEAYKSYIGGADL
ncbi:Fur-regulated basic protein FbpA (plasmid) [Sutcliffiella horikoshii]|nr:Fur-regulated basic protein FbpA [Sutcliffiella horikoshii]UAL49711.1 Fur-regulated basic protein FbpA [Sutcliffiella horikoshii]